MNIWLFTQSEKETAAFMKLDYEISFPLGLRKWFRLFQTLQLIVLSSRSVTSSALIAPTYSAEKSTCFLPICPGVTHQKKRSIISADNLLVYLNIPI